MANLLTVSRVVLVFVVVAVWSRGGGPAGGWLDVLMVPLLAWAILMDALDGWAARYWKEESPAGALFDIAGDRIVELTLWTFFATRQDALGNPLVPLAVPVVMITRTVLTDLVRSAAFAKGRTPFGPASLHPPGWASQLTASRWSRAAYGVAKAICFCMLGLALALGEAPVTAGAQDLVSLVADVLVYLTVAFGIVRALPVLRDGRSYLVPPHARRDRIAQGAWLRRWAGTLCVLGAGLALPNAATSQTAEGGLYREVSRPEVYLISGGKKVWIPTPSALFALGAGWSRVVVVPNGSLSGYPRFDIPSGSPTPGSLVFPPDHSSHFPLAAVPGSVRLTSQGKEVRLAELRGWLRSVDGICGDGADFHYALELDTDWALTRGIDLNAIYRVGNVVIVGLPLPGFLPRRMVSLPLIKVELNSSGWRGRGSGSSKPADWTFVGNCGRTWPFDHYHPSPGSTLQAMGLDLTRRGPYVRVSGSLITDSPHDVQHRPGTLFSRVLAITPGEQAEWEGSVPDWHPGVSSNSPAHYARWTEVHPPDLIEVLAPVTPRVAVRSVALAARVGVLPFGLSNSCEEVVFDLAPEGLRPLGARLRYEERRGPETYWPWGENAENGSWILVFNDRVRVTARVCGGALGGSPGRFKAIYRVWWEPVSTAVAIPRGGSFLTTTDRNEVHYLVEPNTVAADRVEIRLCLGPGLTWEKRLNVPDGQGASWNLAVRDNTRCASNTLPAARATGGQSLTFSKAKFLGQMTQVHQVPLSAFGPLSGGSRVTFTWITD